MRMRGPLTLGIVVCWSVLLPGCSQDHDGSWAGSVTTIEPVLCVGRYAAAGECFSGVSTATKSQLRVGDCVFVVFGAPDAGGRYELKSIKPAAAKDHERDCPV
jgi:hypothetical protein